MYPLTLSRPYANAAFSIASAEKSEKDWATFLHHFSDLLSTKAKVSHSFSAFLTDPRMTADAKMATVVIIFDKSGGKWGEGNTKKSQVQFLKTLADTKRLTLIPAIAKHFDASWAKASNEDTVYIESAYPMSANAEKSLCAKLEKIFGIKLTAKTTSKPELLGGFRAMVGDRVSECSLQSNLNKAKITLIQ